MWRARYMCRYLLGWLLVLLFFFSCSGESPAISVVCEENSVGNCIIKWELTPSVEGKVKIYAATSPDNIPEKDPVAIANIEDQRIVIVTTDPTKRYYYKMIFNNRYKVVTASRNTNIPGIQNFRDIGGYPITKKKGVRWGKLYRAAEIKNLSYSAIRELKNMSIKTVIDLRDMSESPDSSKELQEKGFNVVHVPIGILNTQSVIDELRKGKIRNDSIQRLVLRINRELVTYYRSEYKKMFDVLLDEDNYPVVISCSSGKGRTGVASALILSALGVSEDYIMLDYRMSNDYFDLPVYLGFAYNLPAHSQEALTTLFSARESFLREAMNQIEKNYGNMDTYLKRGLGLTPENLEKLKGILLK